MKRQAAVLVALALISFLPALAQSTNPQIIRADYGSGNQWVDVTARVQSLAANSPRFRVDDETLGVYNQSQGAKTLRVEVRDQYGSSRQYSFRQNEYADLSGRSGSYQDNENRGRRRYRQGNLQITSARYGSGYRSTDVTELLNSRIQNGRLEFQVNSSIIGTDPAPNRTKTLTVHYTYNGQTGQAVFRDGEYARLPEPDESGYDQGTYGNNTYGSNLQITRATYGSWNHTRDVTSQLNSQIRNGELHLQVTSTALGGDPAPGQSKTLNLEYMLNGQSRQVTVRDGEALNLPEGTQASPVYQGSQSQTIVCESPGAERRFCPANTSGGVRLSRQFSTAACRQGSTWGYDSRGVWVSNGCRAEFQLSSAYGSNSSVYGPSIMIPNGTQLSVRTNENIDSAQTTEGQRFSGVMAEEVRDSSGNVAIPKGSDVQLVIRNTEDSNLALDIDSIAVGGRQYSVSTSDLEKKGGSGIGANKRTAKIMGGGALAGAIIGAIAGGGKGAAIGAAVGAAGGAGVQVLTGGKEVKVPAETVLTFRLDSDLQLQANQY